METSAGSSMNAAMHMGARSEKTVSNTARSCRSANGNATYDTWSDGGRGQKGGCEKHARSEGIRTWKGTTHLASLSRRRCAVGENLIRPREKWRRDGKTPSTEPVGHHPHKPRLHPK